MTESISKRELDQRGICQKSENPDLWEAFFAESAVERRAARNLCLANGGCPVRAECLKWALEHKEIWGVWGGCDESELRRALWVDANGEATERCRYPHCPYCKARPNKLFVTGVCEIKSGKRREQVECGKCGFSWRAATSVSAVKAYWRERTKVLRARATRARIPTERPNTNVVPFRPSEHPGGLERPTAIAASGRPR